MFKINNPRTIIISTPRCGSSALTEYIASFNDIIKFNEPYLKTNKGETIEDFKTAITENNPFVVKIHALDFYKYNYEFPIGNYFKIRIRRKNLVEQIASTYVSIERSTWVYRKKTKLDEMLVGEVDIDSKKIQRSIWIIKRYNRFVDTYDFLQDVKFDMDVWYEDIREELEHHSNISLVKTPLPSNYNDLIKSIEKYI